MANAVKTAAVAEMAEAFRGSSAVVLTEYRGLSVKQLKDLRQALAGNAQYAIVKNTLTKIFDKTGARSRTELAIMLVRAGWPGLILRD